MVTYLMQKKKPLKKKTIYVCARVYSQVCTRNLVQSPPSRTWHGSPDHGRSGALERFSLLL